MNEPAERSASVVAALAALTALLDDPALDLAASLADLEDACRLSVASYLGLSVRAAADGRELGFSTLDGHHDPEDIVTSLRLSMTPAAQAGALASIVLVLYATKSGAFVDLAADLDWLLGALSDGAVLDADLGGPTFTRLDAALIEMSTIDQAVGLLIGRGSTSEQAHDELVTRSRRNGRTVLDEAQRLLAELDPDG